MESHFTGARQHLCDEFVYYRPCQSVFAAGIAQGLSLIHIYHLDQAAKEALKDAVREFKGTVILVSHEPEFYTDIVTDIWNIEDWTVKTV